MAVLGKPGRGEQQEDPRDDREYKDQLASIGSSIRQQEDFARSRIPREQIRARLARQGIEAKLRSQVKPVTDADVTASYNSYKLREIALLKGKLPEEQFKAHVAKIVAEIRSGGDFAKIARDNSDAPSKGAVQDISFDNRMMLPPEVRDALEKMKAGDVSPAIETSFAAFIVKLESVTPKLPANLNAKAKQARSNQIAQERETSLRMAFAQQLGAKQRVEVVEPELLAYWNLSQARQSFSNPVEYKRKLKMAIGALKRERARRPNNSIAICKLADLLNQDGQTEKAIGILYPMLEGANATIEGADLRMLLGDMLLKKGEKDRALAQYKVASEVAMNDQAIHQQLVMKFQQLKQPALVAQENKWLDDYRKRLAESKAMQGNAPGRPAPVAPVPVQPAPKPGQ
jgi:tetratricopeptide (TPR) repeat protein